MQQPTQNALLLTAYNAGMYQGQPYSIAQQWHVYTPTAPASIAWLNAQHQTSFFSPVPNTFARPAWVGGVPSAHPWLGRKLGGGVVVGVTHTSLGTTVLLNVGQFYRPASPSLVKKLPPITLGGGAGYTYILGAR